LVLTTGLISDEFSGKCKAIDPNLDGNRCFQDRDQISIDGANQVTRSDQGIANPRVSTRQEWISTTLQAAIGLRT
jgi:hypothetical protein